MGHSVSQKAYEGFVQNWGKAKADKFLADNNLEIIPEVGQFQPIKAVGGPNMEPDYGVADEDAADNTAQEAPASDLSVPVKGDAYSNWESRQAQYLKDLSAQRQKQLADAKAYIEQNYRGPSLSEQLFAISQALLTPTRIHGFKGTLANMAPAFMDIAKAQREANQQRAEALFKLQQQYDKGVMDERGDVLKSELALIKARGSGSPQFSYATDRGGYVPKPGTGTMPPMPDMDEYGNYVITDQRQLVYLPANSPIVLPGGDPLAPKYTKAGTTR